MPVEVDFRAYHKSIAIELKATKDRIRNLIGNAHWATDGQHKEAVLRKTLRTYLPESLKVGTGFVAFEQEPSTQLDIVIINKNYPTLFKDGELVIVTPECVEAIIEVKTKQHSTTVLTETLTSLANQAEKIRRVNPRCWTGLFIFDEHSTKREAWSQRLLDGLHQAANINNQNNASLRAINCVSNGPQLFSRYWPEENHFPAKWHSYIFPTEYPDLTGMAQAYFISNLIWALVPNDSAQMDYALFPIRYPGGKEDYRHEIKRLQE